MEIIKVEKVTKSYVIYEKKPGLLGIIKSFFKTKKIIKNAVDDISFSVNEGEIIGYIGPNGAGKSTTIKMLTGILTPTEGEIFVDGIVPYKTAVSMRKNRCSLWTAYAVMVDLPLNESFTVLKEIYRVPDKEYLSGWNILTKSLVKRIYETNGSPIVFRSKNESRAAGSFLHNPKIVYLDEPTIGLDIVPKKTFGKPSKKLTENLKQPSF